MATAQYGGGVATTFRVRPQPCSRCGGKVIVLEQRETGLGGLWRRGPHVVVRHADFEPGPGRTDQVDGACSREPELHHDLG